MHAARGPGRNRRSAELGRQRRQVGGGAADAAHVDVRQPQAAHRAAQGAEQSRAARRIDDGQVGDHPVVAVEGRRVRAADGRPVGVVVVGIDVAVAVRVEIQVRGQLVAGADVRKLIRVRAVRTAHALRRRRAREGGVVGRGGAHRRRPVAVQIPAQRVQPGQRVDLDQQVVVGVVVRAGRLVVVHRHQDMLRGVAEAAVRDVHPLVHRVGVVRQGAHRHGLRRVPVLRRERQRPRQRRRVAVHRDLRVVAGRRDGDGGRRRGAQRHRVGAGAPLGQRQALRRHPQVRLSDRDRAGGQGVTAGMGGGQHRHAQSRQIGSRRRPGVGERQRCGRGGGGDARQAQAGDRRRGGGAQHEGGGGRAAAEGAAGQFHIEGRAVQSRPAQHRGARGRNRRRTADDLVRGLVGQGGVVAVDEAEGTEQAPWGTGDRVGRKGDAVGVVVFPDHRVAEVRSGPAVLVAGVDARLARVVADFDRHVGVLPPAHGTADLGVAEADVDVLAGDVVGAVGGGGDDADALGAGRGGGQDGQPAQQNAGGPLDRIAAHQDAPPISAPRGCGAPGLNGGGGGGGLTRPRAKDARRPSPAWGSDGCCIFIFRPRSLRHPRAGLCSHAEQCQAL